MDPPEHFFVIRIRIDTVRVIRENDIRIHFPHILQGVQVSLIRNLSETERLAFPHHTGSIACKDHDVILHGSQQLGYA